MLSCNANFLFPADPMRSWAKSARLNVIASEADILALQETRGGKADFAVRHLQFAELFCAFAAVGSSSRGGAPTLVRRSWCRPGGVLFASAVVPGRILRTTISDDSTVLTV